ncbi:hypothetical protein [Pectobacterium phage Wc4-1]|uniref:Uncharacterized protein n=1 Tax=Pectobacterium phage Wc4 TaxID=2652428 RepID=A0A5P8D453_9CAUD|nr:hypothetical protein [Pectobacterium phage Wc4]QFP93918.1 hypothetical protein [Pectobacterium phage Wc4-1]
MSGNFFAYQTGYDGAWLDSPVDVAHWLKDLLGFTSASLFLSVVEQVEALQVNQEMIHEDLSLSITRFS